MTQEELALQSALMGSGLVQPISSSMTLRGKKSAREVNLQVLCRQVPGQEAPWLKVVDKLLTAFEFTTETSPPMDLHLCRRYLRKNKKMVYGWHIELSGLLSGIEGALQTVAGALHGVRPALDPVEPARRAQAARGRASEAQETLEGGDPDDLLQGRPPGPAAAGVERPLGARPAKIRVIRRGTDGTTGKPYVEEEMPLPHVYREMNRPNAKGRGATFTAGSEQPQTGRR